MQIKTLYEVDCVFGTDLTCCAVVYSTGVNQSVSDKTSHNYHYLFEANELSTIKESSSRVIMSSVSCGFISSSPLFLKLVNERSTTAQLAATSLSFASISFSLTALIQISFKSRFTLMFQSCNYDTNYLSSKSLQLIKIMNSTEKVLQPNSRKVKLIFNSVVHFVCYRLLLYSQKVSKL